jgi:hypothetical protein
MKNITLNIIFFLEFQGFYSSFSVCFLKSKSTFIKKNDNATYVTSDARRKVRSLFGRLVADGWCWFVLREMYCWLVADLF